ncbi:hypothetical protein FJV46_01020 [Arthrobacter agilis]|uniref:Wzz/FepE/Etk N-terminal domain-containing protein n=1 Tax=Arthrobacter agilis TaxID=37921 RepID=UPI000B3586FE|nr:Wzz/FepE/Etk N-terminal domain-containing protein [Arthrobacter agilis]OUM40479.1 hypothetical protein B8W74_13245 [Arthrobacter agilis]PPB45092.1 hypothetical protein CI784_13265 [Arthrobacter agilis]TPV27796.1 hypothetical protein FJV46_01020 [Arthrobacter agilis]VDR31550.1 Capsular polysaccharide type 8 biosynthesis protein cap8A [Arthrobacter agilis]
MELNDYGRIFRRRWRLIAVSTLIGLLLAALVTGLSGRTYEAEANLFIRADSDSSSSFENSQFVLQRVKSYPELVYSPQVLTPVLQELDSALTLTELRDRVGASNPAETVFVDVTATAPTPEEAATLANLVAENLRDVIRQLEGGDTARNAAVEAFVTVPAVAPASATSPNTALNLAMGLLAGLSLGLIAALLLGSGYRRIRGDGDLPRSVDVEVLGSVAGGVTTRGGLSQETALQYRELMTALLTRRGGQLPKLLMVTAVGRPNETSNAFSHQFASFIGDSGARTCLLDATTPGTPSGDPGSGGSAREIGFTDVLVGDATLNDVVSVSDAGVHQLPIGTSTERISHSRAARQGASILKEIDDAFDVTLVRTSYDSHPLTTWTVAPVAEATLVLVSHGTASADVEDALRELRAIGVEPLGMVVVGGPRRSGGRTRGRAHLVVRTPGRA